MIDWSLLGTIGGGLAIAVSTGWGLWQKARAAKAEAKVSSAENEAAISRAEASKEVFDLVKAQLADVTARLATAEGNIDVLREQVRARDNRIHAMEMHIRDMEAILTQHGIPIPVRPM